MALEIENTGFIVAKKEFADSLRSAKSVFNFFVYNPGFTYLIVKSIKLMSEERLVILSGLCFSIGIGGVIMYGLIPFLDEEGKNEGVNFYLYFCFLQGIVIPIMFIVTITNNLWGEAIFSIIILGVELTKFTLRKRSKWYGNFSRKDN